MWQSLLLMSLAYLWLFSWSQLQSTSPCYLWFIFITPVIAVIAIGMLESSLMRRHAVVGMYLKPDSGLYRLLRGGILLLLWQIFKAVLFGVFLFVELSLWDAWLWLLLLADILLLWVLYHLLLWGLKPHTKAGYDQMFARHYLTFINTAIGALLFALLSYHMPHTNYTDLSWQAAADYAVRQVDIHCEELAILARLSELKQALAWWVAQHWLTQVPNEALRISGWLLFLLSAAAFFWGYSRLMLGILVVPHRLLVRLDKSVPIAHH